MPISLKIYSHDTGKKTLVSERVLNDQRITVGRGQTCTLLLEDPGKRLSRLHAEFERTARGYLLRVMSGASPVFVNGASYSQGSEVAVHAGDTYAMAGYDLEVVSVSAAKASSASTQARPPAPPSLAPSAASGTSQAGGQSADTGSGRPRRFAVAGAAAVAVALVLAVAWPAIKGLLPQSTELKKSEQKIARLEGEARSLLKLVEGDRREIRESTAASNREIERVEGLVRSTRSSQDRLAFDAALGEARRMSKAAAGLEDKVRGTVDGPLGLPKAEGKLGAATAAARSGDREEAVRLLEDTVATLMQMRARIAEDRKTVQAEIEKRREDLLAAETRAIAAAEARAKAEEEARARAKARADAEAAAANEADPAAQSAQIPALPCLKPLSGVWSHPAGGTWTFAGNQGTRVIESREHGHKASQITVINVYACEKGTMTYKLVRSALTNTDLPGQAYDRTEANAPDLSMWAKTYNQRYSIGSEGLRFGKYTYARR